MDIFKYYVSGKKFYYVHNDVPSDDTGVSVPVTIKSEGNHDFVFTETGFLLEEDNKRLRYSV